MTKHEGLSSSKIKRISHATKRKTKDFDLAEAFNVELGTMMKKGQPVLDNDGNPVRKTKKVKGFVKAGPLTPERNDYFKFPRQDLFMFLMALEQGDTIYLQGHSGAGKTEMVQQIANRLNYNVVQVNFDGHLLRSDLIGEMKIVDAETKFRYGLVPLGFTLAGTILLFDEVDAVAPETAFVLQRAISGDRKMLLHETNEQFELHPQNCIVATANTSGMGDDTSLYIAGTNVQNFSFQNRWDTVLQIDYLDQKDEEEILAKIYPKANTKVVTGVASVMAHARAGFKAGKLTAPLTIRDSIRWLQKMSQWPLPMLTAEYTFLNRMVPEDALAVAEIIQRNFKLPKRDSTKFVKRGEGKNL